MNVTAYFPNCLLQSLTKKLIVDTRQYSSHQYRLKLQPTFKYNLLHNVMQVVPLHHYPELLEQCCDLVNSEWKRSRTARMRSLETSCDHLPTNLVLIQAANVIGHSKLSVIPTMPDACYLESVVIDKLERGKGYGKYLMKQVEDHCRHMNLKYIFLSTKDKETFYTRLGYTTCPPVSIYGHSAPSPSNYSNFNMEQRMHYSQRNNTNAGPPPPPPPSYIYNGGNSSKKVYMSKTLN